MKALLFIIILVSAIGAWLYFNPSVWQGLVKDTPLAPPPAVTELYKWQDASGEWQVSDQPPPGDTPHEVMRFRSDTNVVPAIEEEED